ncbi:plasma membrane fusion protein PRM1 [Dioszegia hungarica]|uniref:Plasma membrane fusion protein PRM1 n=1 Tax=Dioszegia hungarica TaxID=4972 RepID=A0AA38H9R1_9TREE|nr:plasma membrane fusion protein PRM1 [Dioszegia hungarica]KAI9636910.1 plasma membrane fusion protein PRM1 [Dioszegia hungarica]
MSGAEYLAPPRTNYINPDHIVPLTPPSTRPPFAHYHSTASLPHTPTDMDRYKSPPPPAASGTRLRPHLTLAPRLLLTTLSPALIPLILTIAHLIANRSSTTDMAASLRSSMLSACSGLAKGAATLQTLPRYLAMQTNEEMVRAAQATIRGIGSVLMDVVTVVEVVVIFMLDTYRSLLMCTIELAVRGTLELMIGAVKGISDGVTSSLNAARSNIQNDIASANRFIQEAATKLNSATSLISVNISIPQFSIPSLSSLQDVKVSTDFQDSLVRLNATIPSLTALREKLNTLTEKPFNLLKAEMNSTRLELASSFNTSMLPTPSLSSLSANAAREMEAELCGNLDTSLVDDTANALHKLANISIGLMILVLFLVWGTLCVWEWRRWKAMKDTVELVVREWEREGRADAWRAVAIIENPVLEKYGSPVLRRFTRSERTRINVRWYLAYLSHPTCLALLFIAAIGFLSLQLQLVALNGIRNHARANANATVAQSTNSITAKLNAMATNASRQYAADYNLVVAGYQKRIDEELFGHWVNTTGVALNATLVDFYDDIEKVLNQTFGGTVLYNPINTFMYCILGSKIDSLSAALTWLRDHAHINLPTLPPDVLMLSPAAMAEMTGPISAAAVGSGTGADGKDDEGIVGDLIRHFQQAIEYERNFYATLIGVWLGFALVGLLVVAWNSGGEERYRSWRGQEGESEAAGPGGGGEEKVWPWTKEKTPVYDEHTEQQFRGTAPPTPVAGQQSFIDYNDAGHTQPRPFLPRKSTFGSIASLMAPGENFLKFGRSKTPLLPDDSDRLVHPGTSSEGYNFAAQPAARAMIQERERQRPRSDLETPPPFWVKRFAGDGVKSFFPSRGQRHGEAMQNGAGMGTIERLDTDDTVPSFGRTDSGRDRDETPQPGYPRPMSRASTVATGRSIKVVPARNPFENPPAMPGKHDSVDMLDDGEYDNAPVPGSVDYSRRYSYGSEGEQHGWPAGYDIVGHYTGASGPGTPMSEMSEARVESVHVGRAAEAGILMNERRRRGPLDGMGRI